MHQCAQCGVPVLVPAEPPAATGADSPGGTCRSWALVSPPSPSPAGATKRSPSARPEEHRCVAVSLTAHKQHHQQKTDSSPLLRPRIGDSALQSPLCAAASAAERPPHRTSRSAQPDGDMCPHGPEYELELPYDLTPRVPDTALVAAISTPVV